MGEPARGYSWEPFQRGHILSLRHGFQSERTWKPLAEELAARLIEQRPDLAAFPFAVSAWSRAESRLAILEWWVDKVGMLEPDGGLNETFQKWLNAVGRLAAERRAELGLNPRDFARLQREVAEAAMGRIDVEALMLEGRKALESRSDE